MAPLDPTDLAARFLEHLPASRADGVEPADLAAPLAAVLAEGREQWPGVEPDVEGFLAFLAQRLPPEGHPVEALAQLKTASLYLAYACLRGTPGAAEAFARAFHPVLGRALSGVTAEASQIDDIKQAVYQKLFVPAGDKTPAIHKYDGRGELRSWVRVTAVRMALNLHRDRRRERPLSPQVLLTRPDDRIGPEEDYLKRLYSDAFKQAFEQALQSLRSEQRNLLRYYYIDSLTVEQIGHIYRVHKATISRRLADIREQLLTETRNHLVRQLDVGHTEFESIMRLIHSRLDASICRYLKPG